MARYLTQRWVVHDSRFLKTKTLSSRGNVLPTDCSFDEALANRAFSKAKALYHKLRLVPDGIRWETEKAIAPKHRPQNNTKIRSCQSFFSRKYCNLRRSSLRCRDTRRSFSASLANGNQLIGNSILLFAQSLAPKALWLLQSTIVQ